jgi:hypothetical protein
MNPCVKMLHGIVAPPGDGMVIEVHLDIMEAPPAFLDRLCESGFEYDPFLEFYPAEYRCHYTGRTRAVPSDVANVLRDIRALTAQVIETAQAADVRMYVESELVRDIHHFPEDNSAHDLSALHDCSFRKTGQAGTAKADIHIEFRSGTVPCEVREFLLARDFYWVRTPSSERFPSEEIATLQTAAFDDAQRVYSRLVACPLPACTGIHLEQKLAMIASHPNLPMPAVVAVIRDEDPRTPNL